GGDALRRRARRRVGGRGRGGPPGDAPRLSCRRPPGAQQGRRVGELAPHARTDIPSAMIGARVSSRVRMSAHDAHYAGELVDGGRVLSLFGDAATELLIRIDGDEGLFRAYENVEFLAPVFAGDFLEVSAEVIAFGNTSRKILFEAKKVIAN